MRRDLSGGARRLPQPLEWLFRDRLDGGITIAQFPNLALWVFVVAAVARYVADPSGSAGAVVNAVADAALAWWAIDEVARGVNPWRRILGATVLVVVAAGLVLG